MKTLPYDISRCAGRSPLRDTICERRDTCARYKAMRRDMDAGRENYQGVPVMAQPPGEYRQFLACEGASQ